MGCTVYKLVCIDNIDIDKMSCCRLEIVNKGLQYLCPSDEFWDFSIPSMEDGFFDAL